MASIHERLNEDGTFSYRVSIRKKGTDIYKTFKDKKTAELYAWYKETLIDDMINFEVPKKELITLQDAIEIKLTEFKTKLKAGKYIDDTRRDGKTLMDYFSPDILLKDIKLEDIEKFAEEKLKTTVFRGGNNGKGEKKTGKQVAISPHTVRRMIAALSSFYTVVNKETNAGIENIAICYMASFRNKYLRKEEK